MKNLFKNFLKNFLLCGILGWCTEIIFTALQNFRRRNLRLNGTTSLWMFPIYGCGCFLALPFRLLKNCSVFLRGLSYTLLIFIGEYISGRFLWKRNLCPWDYSSARFHIKQVIRLDYAPGWFLLGLIMERLIFKRQSN